MLNNHPEISCTNELGQLLLSEVFAKAIHDFNEMQSGRTHHPDLPGPITPPEARKMLRVLLETRMRFLSEAQSKLIGDKQPLFPRNTGLIFDIFPDARFIHVIRDPRDVLVSFQHYSKTFHPEAAELETTRAARREHARQWASLVRTIRNKALQSGISYKEIQYEQLLRDPAALLSKTADYLGGDSDPEIIASCVERASFKKLSGGRKPGNEDRSSFFRKGVAGDWRNHMTDEDSEAMREASGGLMQEFGYA